MNLKTATIASFEFLELIVPDFMPRSILFFLWLNGFDFLKIAMQRIAGSKVIVLLISPIIT